MIKLEVFTFSFERLGIVEKYDSLQYTQQFQDQGSFQLVCPKTKENIELLQSNRFIWLEDETAGIIQYFEKERDTDAKITIKGNLMKGILDWRWVYPCFTKTANPATLMELLVNNHCINPTDANRKLPSLVIGTDEIITMPSITFQKTGGSVLEAEQKLSEANGLGFDIRFNPRNENKLKFVVLKGKDRTQNNRDGNDPVIFSRSLNNVVKGDYTYNDGDFKNVALVAGEAIDGSDNENANRRTYEVYRDAKVAKGFERRELFVDARDLQSTYSEDQATKDEEGNDVTESVEKKMTDEEYNATLLQRGNEKIGETSIEESYVGDIRTDAKTTFHYGVDYFLGDKVTVIDEDLGIAIDVVVTEMEINVDKTGYIYTPTFGNSIPTMLDKLERK